MRFEPFQGTFPYNQAEKLTSDRKSKQNVHHHLIDLKTVIHNSFTLMFLYQLVQYQTIFDTNDLVRNKSIRTKTKRSVNDHELNILNQ